MPLSGTEPRRRTRNKYRNFLPPMLRPCEPGTITYHPDLSSRHSSQRLGLSRSLTEQNRDRGATTPNPLSAPQGPFEERTGTYPTCVKQGTMWFECLSNGVGASPLFCWI